MLLPANDAARPVLATIRSVYDPVGGFDPVPGAVFAEIARVIYGVDPDGLGDPPDRLRPDLAKQAVMLMALLEYTAHPLRAEVSDAVRAAARRLDTRVGLVDAAPELARRHFHLVYMDLERMSWYTKETVRQSLRGRAVELLRSKLAYEGVVPSRPIAKRWTGLRGCARGTWGRAVADFYEAHRFPFPGQRHGIYELGARHDWVHVLADYDTDPEGEIDVFGFIAASMVDEHGLVLLAFTLSLFQNGSVDWVAGKPIASARADTLSEPGAVARFVEALARGRACAVDVMGSLDLFAYKDVPLDEIRRRYGVAPRGREERRLS